MLSGGERYFTKRASSEIHSISMWIALHDTNPVLEKRLLAPYVFPVATAFSIAAVLLLTQSRRIIRMWKCGNVAVTLREIPPLLGSLGNRDIILQRADLREASAPPPYSLGELPPYPKPTHVRREEERDWHERGSWVMYYPSTTSNGS